MKWRKKNKNKRPNTLIKCRCGCKSFTLSWFDENPDILIIDCYNCGNRKMRGYFDDG